MAKRISVEDIDVPDFAEEVSKGYPTAAFIGVDMSLDVHIFGPVMASPRPRVTSRGTFMPSDYRKHCDMLACSMAYARGIFEAKEEQEWPSQQPMSLRITVFSPKMPGDLDNIAKTFMDAGQLHRGEEPGAELWLNDRQIQSLAVSWLDSKSPTSFMTLLRVTLGGPS